jgi:hypothetical protein
MRVLAQGERRVLSSATERSKDMNINTAMKTAQFIGVDPYNNAEMRGALTSPGSTALLFRINRETSDEYCRAADQERRYMQYLQWSRENGMADRDLFDRDELQMYYECSKY